MSESEISVLLANRANFKRLDKETLKDLLNSPHVEDSCKCLIQVELRRRRGKG